MDEDKHASQQRDTEPLQISGSTDQSMSPADRDLDVMRQDYLGPCISIKRERTTELEPLFSPTSSCHAHSARYNVTSPERGWLNAEQKHLESVTAISVNGKSREDLVVGDCSLETSQSGDIPVDQGPAMIKDNSNTHEIAIRSLKRLLIERKKSSEISDLTDGRVNEAEEDQPSSKQLKISHPTQRCSDCGKQLPVNSRYCGCQNKSCPKCARSFKSEQQLSRHMQKAHASHPFSCPVCGKTFTTKYTCKEHYLSSHSSRPYVCAQCGKSFGVKRYLKKHIIHSTCGKLNRVDHQAAAGISSSSNIPAIIIRQTTKPSNRPATISWETIQTSDSPVIITRETAKPSNPPATVMRKTAKPSGGSLSACPSRQHLSRAAKSKKTVSYGDDEDFDPDDKGRESDEDFDSDEEGRDSDDDYSNWSDDGDPHTNNSNMPINHQPICDVPARAQSGGHVCSRCGHSFLSNYAHIRHIQEVHFDFGPYLCSICQKSYKTINSHNQHMTSHSLKLPLFQCGRCGQSFGLKRDLSLHMAGHSEDNLYILNSQGQLENTKSQTSLPEIGHSSMSSSDSCMENNIRTPESSDLGNIEPRSLTSCEATEQSVLSQTFSTSVHHIIENDSGLEDGEVMHSTPSNNVRINSGDVVSEPYSCSTCDKDHCDSHITAHSSCGSKLKDAGDREHHTDFSSTRKRTGTDKSNMVTFPRRHSHGLKEPSNEMTSPSPGRHSLSRAVKEKSRRSYADEESCDNDVPNSDTDFDPDNDDGTWSAKHMPDIHVKTSISENVKKELKLLLARRSLGLVYKCANCDQCFGLKQDLEQHMVVHGNRPMILDTEECLDDSKHQTDWPVSWCSSTSTSSGQDNKTGRTKSLNFVDSCGIKDHNNVPVRGLSIILEKLPIRVGEVVIVKSAQESKAINRGIKQTFGTLKIYKCAGGNSEINGERCESPQHQSRAMKVNYQKRPFRPGSDLNNDGSEGERAYHISQQKPTDSHVTSEIEKPIVCFVSSQTEEDSDNCVTIETEKPTNSHITSDTGEPADSCVANKIKKPIDTSFTFEIDELLNRVISEIEESSDSRDISEIEESYDSCVTSEMETHVSTDSCVTTKTEEPSDSGMSSEKERTLSCFKTKMENLPDSDVSSESRKPSANQVIGSSETPSSRSSAEPNPVHSTDSSETSSRAVKEKSRRSYADEESCDNDCPNSDTDFDPDNDDGTWSVKHMPDIRVKTSISENVNLARRSLEVAYKCAFCDQGFGLKQHLEQHMVVHGNRPMILDTEECLDDTKHQTDRPVWCSGTSTSSGQDNKTGRTKSLNFVDSCGIISQNKIPIRGLSIILEKHPIRVGEVVIVKSAQKSKAINRGFKQTFRKLKIYKSAGNGERCESPQHQSQAMKVNYQERPFRPGSDLNNDGNECERAYDISLQKPTNSHVTSQIEKPIDCFVTSRTEKASDNCVTIETKKPTDSHANSEIEKPTDSHINSDIGEPTDSCVANKIKMPIDTNFTFEIEPLNRDTSEIEESSDSRVTSEIEESSDSCATTKTEEPSDSGMSSEKEKTLSYFKTKMEKLPDSDVSSESRKPSVNQVTGSSETLSGRFSAESNPVHITDPSESWVNSGRRRLSRTCKQTESVSYVTKMSLSDFDDDDDDQDWTDEGDTSDSNNKITSDAINNRHCSRCGKHYPENGTDHCDCQESTDNQDGDNEPIKPHETRSGPSDWGRTGIPDKACSKCDEVFVTETYLRIHISKVHTEGMPSHLCSTCGKRFTCKGRLRVHMTVHTDDRPFLCSVCGKSFKASGCLSKHIENIHRANGKRKKKVPLVYGCSTCGAKFSHRPALKEHTNTYKGHVPKNQCFLCGRIFEGPTTLNKHIQMHQTGKPFKCSHCDESFEFAGKLELHMGKHTSVRDIVCPQCNKGFKRDDHLRRHIKYVHSTEPPSFLCTICGRALKAKFTLDSHVNYASS